MNVETILAKVRELGSGNKAAAALGISRQKVQRAMKAASSIPKSTITTSPVAVEEKTRQPAVGGFALRNIRLLSRKPADSLKSRFWKLRRDMGYPLDVLSKQWGVSCDTLRKHAKDADALKYLEATPGEFVAVVVHPETGKIASEKENII